MVIHRIMNNKIIAIAAVGGNNVIGSIDGGLPWPPISEDFKHFKKETMGHPMIVGGITFREFPKPLPGRDHIVVARKNIGLTNLERVHHVIDIQHSLSLAESLSQNGKIFIIGGASIYKQTLQYVNTILLTRIDIDLPHGPSFPEFEKDFEKVSERPQEEDHNLKYKFEIWERK